MDAVDMQLALGRAPGLTAQQLRSALARLTSTACAAASPTASLAALIGQRRGRLQALGLPAAASTALEAPPAQRLADDRAWVQREHITLIDALSPRYPALLSEAPEAPALLYVSGDPTSLCSAQLAMVGSRSPTEGGRRTACEFAGYLAQAGLTITSGLALGIDAASHEGALAVGGRSIAVLGSGLDRIYPHEHRSLAARIAARGALVSEYPPGAAPLKQNFPRRNRIIAALARGTLVVEATRESGSLITAQLAVDLGREVFAIPGSIHNPLARGCHALIRQGATLVENGQQVLDELNFSLPQQLVMPWTEGCGDTVATVAALDKGYKILLDALGFEPAGVDTLVERTGLPSQSVASMLLILELEGAVELQPGGRYLRLPGRAAVR
ncbi:MAG TPA: DNA-processing protein DprA [Steroidobacteraceae bacterium]|jgi:DNA processing protein|nr:DNA-processing protein DprA [Steroidobacteraceae bacterium]